MAEWRLIEWAVNTFIHDFVSRIQFHFSECSENEWMKVRKHNVNEINQSNSIKWNLMSWFDLIEFTILTQYERSDSFNSTAQSIQCVEIELMADWNELNTKRTKANEINPFQFNSEIEMKLDDWVAMLKKERIQSIHSFLSVKCNGVDESRAVYTSLIDSIALSFVFFKWNEMKCIEIKSIIL